MVARRRPQRRRRNRNGNGMGAQMHDFTNFNGKTRFRVAYGIELNSLAKSVGNYQINKRTLGSNINPLWSSMTGLVAGFPVQQIRVVSLIVHFDGRAASSTVSPAANPRVGACIVPFSESELNPTPNLDNIVNFAGPARSLQSTHKIFLAVGPAFQIGRFGTETTIDTRLMIFQEGFNGTVRVMVNYETTGYPNLTFTP